MARLHFLIPLSFFTLLVLVYSPSKQPAVYKATAVPFPVSPRLLSSHPLLFYQPIDLNRADQALLCQIPGIGPILAQRIIAHRQQYGPFLQMNQLLQVHGIGQAKLAAIKKLAIVQ